MLGLGNSVGTGPDGITAPVIVVRSFHELNTRCHEAKDKIVVFNPRCDWKTHPLLCYDTIVLYRVGAASYAALCGAKAALVRSVASRSIDSPHTGEMSYVPVIS